MENSVKDDEHYSYAMQLVNSSVLPMVMHAAIELEVFEILAKAGEGAKLSSSEIAKQMPTKNPDAPMMIDRILNLLAAHSVLACSVDDGGRGTGSPQRLYGLTPVSNYFVMNKDGVSLGRMMALIQDKVFLDIWSQLKDAVLEGGVPFNRAYGMNVFDYAGKDSRFNQVLNTAMRSHTTIVVKQILESYKGFEQLNKLVDIGGGLGVTLSLITSKYPSIAGINFDLPHVVQQAPSYPGVEHVGGDMFVSVPKGDALLLKWILHDWSDEHCLKLLKNCYNAIPDDGKVIIVDGIRTVMPEPGAAWRVTSENDVLMITQSPGGKERTQQEFMALATEAGFKGSKFECLACNSWVMEFFK
ncbi:caffeic acid 3-O-methyltransferase 1-like [Tripterygium wilfordii]|uniref:caffeic acid 3-O-methyltransferase 1-like n=1 Tax=Tripterygium wilfordii TaxID=458696 RepID=UPI0018F81903|nr:caffeic acid 3-O-methyltransferase 1-like [Tripterygium wilfordii]